MISFFSLPLTLALVTATGTPPPGDATGPLPEGDSGFFCKTHDGSKRLFRHGDFFYCGNDAHLPARITYAVLGDAPAGLAPALRRFGNELARRTGIAIEPSLRPDVLLVASPTTPPPKEREAYRRAAEALVAKGGVTLPPEFEASGIHLDLTSVFSETTEAVVVKRTGRPKFTVTSFYAGSDAVLSHVVKDAFTAFLAIEPPTVKPEEVAKTPGGISYASRLRLWLQP